MDSRNEKRPIGRIAASVGVGAAVALFVVYRQHQNSFAWGPKDIIVPSAAAAGITYMVYPDKSDWKNIH